MFDPDRKGSASMTWFVASWAGAVVVVCRWLWGATNKGSSLEEAKTLQRLKSITELRVPTS